VIGETVTRVRPELVADRYGGTVKNWDDTTEDTIDGCAVAPRLEGETTTGNREGVVIGWTVYAPADADVLATDRLRIRDVDHDVDGEPGEWRSPFSGARKGLEIRTRRVAG
jgi:hypothetical protein